MSSQSATIETPRLLHSKWMLACGNFFFHVRNGLFPVIFLTLVVLVRPNLFLGDPVLDRMIMIAGAVIALAGQFVRLFVIGYAYIRRGGKNRKIYADDLVIAGLYAHTRNPMYVGNFLIACGFSLYYGSAWLCALLIPFFGWVYLAITAAEEQFLFGKFGSAYEDYMKQVNRFVPTLRGLSQTLSGQRFRWREVLSKEYGTLFSTVAGLTGIAMWKAVCLQGWAAEKDHVIALAWLFVPITLFYIVVRYFKMTGRLKEPVA
jgi:protein-S-isoprenylcysteine O-methyltransferase Ste14